MNLSIDVEMQLQVFRVRVVVSEESENFEIIGRCVTVPFKC
jgi:archaeosine-15-forming tRNA-guanine transglycosylase